MVRFVELHVAFEGVRCRLELVEALERPGILVRICRTRLKIGLGRVLASTSSIARLMTSLIARLVAVASTYFAFGASGLSRYGFLPPSMSIAMPNEIEALANLPQRMRRGEPAALRRGLAAQLRLRPREPLPEQSMRDDRLAEERVFLDLREPRRMPRRDAVRLEGLLLVAVPPNLQLEVDLDRPASVRQP